MKKFISKIRNNRLKGNVSLLVIFILLASSVIALLSINQIQRLLTYGNMTFNYFRAFYLAKAGTELGLTEVYNREAGFEHVVNSGDGIITGNLVGSYEGFNPYFTMNISGNFLHLTDDVRYTNVCNNDYKITLANGEGIVLSLFKDETEGITNNLAGESKIDKLKNAFIEGLQMEGVEWKDNNASTLTFGLFDYNNEGDMQNIFVDKLRPEKQEEVKNFLSNINSLNGNNRRYLTIKNHGTGGEVVSFCIVNVNGRLIPYSDSLITVRGNYGDMEVGLQSVVKRQSPGWSLNVLGDVKSL